MGNHIAPKNKHLIWYIHITSDIEVLDHCHNQFLFYNS